MLKPLLNKFQEPWRGKREGAKTAGGLATETVRLTARSLTRNYDA